MKKVIFLTLVSIFILCSCSSYSCPFAASSRSCYYNGRIYEIDEPNLYYTPVGGEKKVLCFDPLCDHSQASGCPSVSWGGRSNLAVTEDENGAPVIFFTHENLNLEDGSSTWQIRRMDTADNSVTVLLDTPDRIASFWVYGNTVYLTQPEYITGEDGNLSSAGNNLWTVSLKDGSFNKLTDFTEQSVNIVSITDVDGETKIWWTNYDAATLYISSADFSETETAAEGVLLYGSFMKDGWLYYPQKTGNTVDALTADAHPSDKDADENGKVTLYFAADKWSYVRMNIESGVTETVCEGVCKPSSVCDSLYADGDVIYYIPYEPTYLDTITAGASGLIGNAVEDSIGGEKVQVDYITADSGGKIMKKNLTTGETCEIITTGFDARRILGLSDESLILEGYVTDTERICERLETEGVNSGSFTFSEIIVVDVN